MKLRDFIFLTAILTAAPVICKADTAPFGVASAYNVVALGTSTTPGTFSGNYGDAEGRIAASGTISSANGTTVGATLHTDPYGSLAPYALVGSGITKNGQNGTSFFYVNAPGNAYVPGTNDATGTIYFNNNGGQRVGTAGVSGIDFDTLRTSLQNQSTFLDTLMTSGTVYQPTDAVRPSGTTGWLVLDATHSGLNVFNISATDLANNTIDIIIPPPAPGEPDRTVVVNVSGTIETFNSAFFLNGNQQFDSENTQKILFNFSDATSLTVNQELSASVLAPFAIVTGHGDFDGNVIAASFAGCSGGGSCSEFHNIEFTGNLPPTPPTAPAVPEPGTLALVGTGLASVVGAVRRRKTASTLS